MTITRYMAPSLAVLVALALAAGQAAATTQTTTSSSEEVTSLSMDRITDGRPPTTGPTNPSQRRM